MSIHHAEGAKISAGEMVTNCTTSVKFLVVRHPLTRFVSNWDDHFCFGCETGRAIIARNPDIAPFVKTSLDEDYQIGFKELVQFVNLQ